MALVLTKEQREKIFKLEEEMKAKEEYEIKNRQRKKETSEATGIPVNLIDMDVIKIGIVFGLIKKKDNKTSGSFLLDLLFGHVEKPIDKTLFPHHFRNAPNIVEEEKKIQYIENHVQVQSEKYSELTNTVIKESLFLIRQHIAINLQSWTLENFKITVQEVMDILLDNLMDEVQIDNTNKVTNTYTEDWLVFNIVRRSLLGPCTIFEYKTLLIQFLKKIWSRGFHKGLHSQILQSLSTIEKRLVLYNGCLNIETEPICIQDIKQLRTEMLFRNYNTNPELVPFNVYDVLYSCCTPLLLTIPISVVFEHSFLNPYMTNSLGFLNLGKDWSFYALSKIQDGVRLWVLDKWLDMFTTTTRNIVLDYVVKIFRVFYKECFCTNMFISGFYKKNKNQQDVFYLIIQSINFLNGAKFQSFLQNQVQKKSFLIPTQYDFFNQLTNDELSTQRKDQLHRTRRDVIGLLFDTECDSDFNHYFETILK